MKVEILPTTMKDLRSIYGNKVPTNQANHIQERKERSHHLFLPPSPETKLKKSKHHLGQGAPNSNVRRRSNFHLSYPPASKNNHTPVEGDSYHTASPLFIQTPLEVYPNYPVYDVWDFVGVEKLAW